MTSCRACGCMRRKVTPHRMPMSSLMHSEKLSSGAGLRHCRIRIARPECMTLSILKCRFWIPPEIAHPTQHRRSSSMHLRKIRTTGALGSFQWPGSKMSTSLCICTCFISMPIMALNVLTAKSSTVQKSIAIFQILKFRFGN